MSKLDIRKGDIVRVVRTIEVEEITDEFVSGVAVDDRRPASAMLHRPGTKLEMVKRARRRRPQRQDFKAGDVITGRQVRDVMWKRGTILSHYGDFVGQWVLHADGKWHSLDHSYTFRFTDFPNALMYKIVHLP